MRTSSSAHGESPAVDNPAEPTMTAAQAAQAVQLPGIGHGLEWLWTVWAVPSETDACALPRSWAYPRWAFGRHPVGGYFVTCRLSVKSFARETLIPWAFPVPSAVSIPADAEGCDRPSPHRTAQADAPMTRRVYEGVAAVSTLSGYSKVGMRIPAIRLLGLPEMHALVCASLRDGAGVCARDLDYRMRRRYLCVRKEIVSAVRRP
jgi:hypothetical protein